MAISTFRLKLDALKAAITQYCSTSFQKLETIIKRLNAHTDATGNVHDLEPADIGLGNVPDWLPATKKQAQDALSNNAFMTPRRVDDYTDANIYKVIGDAFKAAADDL